MLPLEIAFTRFVPSSSPIAVRSMFQTLKKLWRASCVSDPRERSLDRRAYRKLRIFQEILNRFQITVLKYYSQLGRGAETMDTLSWILNFRPKCGPRTSDQQHHLRAGASSQYAPPTTGVLPSAHWTIASQLCSVNIDVLHHKSSIARHGLQARFQKLGDFLNPPRWDEFIEGTANFGAAGAGAAGAGA
jgi:hypothetical protein